MEAIHTEQAPRAIGPYSQAIKRGEWLFLSGQIGLSPETMQLVADDMTAQTKQIFKNLNAVLKEAGGSLQNIVKLTVYLKDLNTYSVLNEIMKGIFTMPYPARAAVEVSRLPKEALIEIEAIAILAG